MLNLKVKIPVMMILILESKRLRFDSRFLLSKEIYIISFIEKSSKFSG
jgi:hypothetical protein